MKTLPHLAHAVLVLGLVACGAKAQGENGPDSGGEVGPSDGGGGAVGFSEGGDGPSDDGAIGIDAAMFGDAAPMTFGCGYSTYDYCCVQKAGCGGDMTWASQTACAPGTDMASDYLYYTPCDGWLAAWLTPVVILYDSDGGAFGGYLSFYGGQQGCLYGPPSVTVSQACINLWLSGTGATRQCEGSSTPTDLCADSLPDGG